MYNDYREIIYLVNLMNRNDNRSTVNIKDVFTSDGEFIIDKSGNEIGKELLRRKINGYISYVKGDNPLTFPYRIFPQMFSEKTIKNLTYPEFTFIQSKIDKPIDTIDIVIHELSNYQQKVYK